MIISCRITPPILLKTTQTSGKQSLTTSSDCVRHSSLLSAEKHHRKMRHLPLWSHSKLKPRPKFTQERWQVVIVFLAGKQFNRCTIAAFAAAETFSSLPPENVACRPSVRNSVSHFSKMDAIANHLQASSVTHVDELTHASWGARLCALTKCRPLSKGRPSPK